MWVFDSSLLLLLFVSLIYAVLRTVKVIISVRGLTTKRMGRTTSVPSLSNKQLRTNTVDRPERAAACRRPSHTQWSHLDHRESWNLRTVAEVTERSYDSRPAVHTELQMHVKTSEGIISFWLYMLWKPYRCFLFLYPAERSSNPPQPPSKRTDHISPRPFKEPGGCTFLVSSRIWFIDANTDFVFDEVRSEPCFPHSSSLFGLKKKQDEVASTTWPISEARSKIR